jgi:hypothetical protein
MEIASPTIAQHSFLDIWPRIPKLGRLMERLVNSIPSLASLGFQVSNINLLGCYYVLHLFMDLYSQPPDLYSAISLVLSRNMVTLRNYGKLVQFWVNCRS